MITVSANAIPGDGTRPEPRHSPATLSKSSIGCGSQLGTHCEHGTHHYGREQQFPAENGAADASAGNNDKEPPVGARCGFNKFEPPTYIWQRHVPTHSQLGQKEPASECYLRLTRGGASRCR